MTEQIEDAVQEAQDQLDSLENPLDADNLRQQEEVEDALEVVEDLVEEMVDAREDGNTEKFTDTLGEAKEAIQTTQDKMNELQNDVGFDDADLAARVEEVEDAIELVEDHLHGIDENEPSDDLIIIVNEEEREAPERHMTPLEIVRLFEYDEDNVVLYKARALDDGDTTDDQFLPRDEEIDLCELNKFAAIPSETPYGAAADDSTTDLSNIENDVIVADVERLREEYDVDVRDDADGGFIRVIVRDWDIPSDGYNQDTTDVMIRVPDDYPQTPPDWIYVEESLRVANGDLPKKHSQNRVDEWLALSWHVNKLQEVRWVPFETDLKWYLDTFCDLRFRSGE